MICPKCGENLSSATKVCPCCGYVVDDKMDEYLKQMESHLMTLKSIAPVSFGTYFSNQAYLLYGIMAIAFIIVYFMTGAGLFLILTALAIILLVISLVRKFTGARKNKEPESRFRAALVELETTMRLLKNDYYEAKVVRERLNDIQSELKDVIYRHNANRRRAVTVWIAVLIFTVAVCIAGITVLGNR